MTDDQRTLFKDHFSAVATNYANARPQYPPSLFDWIASIAPARDVVWEAGCGSGQASADLARHFTHVHATDPSAAQIAQAPVIANISFAVEPAEHCSLPDASIDTVCVAQALHWFDRDVFFAECARAEARRRAGGLGLSGHRSAIAAGRRQRGVAARHPCVLAT